MIQNIGTYINTIGFSGLFYAIKAQASNSAVLFKITRKDCKHPFFLRLLSSDIPTYEQVFINQDYDFLVERPPKVIVDAGANIGLASILFANRYPDAKIIAIEPEDSNFDLLKKNVAPYPNIFPLHAALWHKNEEINLIDPGLGKWGFITETNTFPGNLPGRLCHTVMGMTLEKIITDHNIPNINILKIDIEGAEKEVFSDTSLWIEKIDSLIIELHERMKAGCVLSFYSGAKGFDKEWKHGENVYLSKKNYLTKRSSKRLFSFIKKLRMRWALTAADPEIIQEEKSGDGT